MHVNKQIPVGTYRTHITHLPAWVNHVYGTCCALEVMRTNTGLSVFRGGLFLYILFVCPKYSKILKAQFIIYVLLDLLDNAKEHSFFFLFYLWHGPLSELLMDRTAGESARNVRGPVAGPFYIHIYMYMNEGKEGWDKPHSFYACVPSAGILEQSVRG